MSDTTHNPTPRPRRWPYIIPLVTILALGAVFGKRLADVGSGVEVNAIPTVLLNTPVPDIDLPPLPGHAEGIRTADLKGQVYLINFWGSWCGTCVYEHPVLLDIAKSGELPVYGVAWRDKPEKSQAWLDKYRDPFTRVGQDPNSKAAIAFGVAKAPESFLVDKQGVIRYKQPGPILPQAWRTDLLPKVKQLKAE